MNLASNPARKIPPRWGFCFQDGRNEGAFCEAIDAALATQPTGKPFVYVEIGVGHGGALKAVSEYLSQIPGLEYELHGCDVPNYSGHAIDFSVVPENRITLHLCGAENFWQQFGKTPDFVFIDACHGKACVMRDFMGAEWLTRMGGVVCFHDTDPNCQGAHLQPHCGTGIDARAAVEKLGLLHETRHGWRKLNETPGDIGRGVHGCLFVQRV